MSTNQPLVRLASTEIIPHHPPPTHALAQPTSKAGCKDLPELPGADLDFWRGGSFCITTGTGGAQYNVDTNEARPKPDTASACPAGYFLCDNSALTTSGKNRAYNDKDSKGVCYPGEAIDDCPLTDLYVGTAADSEAKINVLTSLPGTSDITTSTNAPYEQFDLLDTTDPGETVGYMIRARDSLVTHAEPHFSHVPLTLPGRDPE